MSEYELLAAVAKNMSRSKAYKFARHGDYEPFVRVSHTSEKVRLIVSRYFELRPEHIVHHEDRNQTNNALYNLKVFASHKDHLRYHAGFYAKPLWEGSKERG